MDRSIEIHFHLRNREFYLMNARAYEILAKGLSAQGIDASHYYNAVQDCLEKAQLELMLHELSSNVVSISVQDMYLHYRNQAA